MCLFGCVCAVSSFWCVQPPAADKKQAWKIILVVFWKFSRLLALGERLNGLCISATKRHNNNVARNRNVYRECVRVVYITIHINKDKRLPFNHCEWCGWRGPGDNEQKYNKLDNVYGLMHYSFSLRLVRRIVVFEYCVILYRAFALLISSFIVFFFVLFFFYFIRFSSRQATKIRLSARRDCFFRSLRYKNRCIYRHSTVVWLLYNLPCVNV